MNHCKELMKGDIRIGEDPLNKRLYEVELPNSSSIDSVNPLKCHQLWSYRQPITISHLKLTVQERNVLSGKLSKDLLTIFLEQVTSYGIQLIYSYGHTFMNYEFLVEWTTDSLT